MNESKKKIKILCLLLTLSVFCVPMPSKTISKLQNEDTPNQSKLTVRMKFKKGKPFIEKTDAMFNPSPLFCKTAKCVKNADGSFALKDDRLKKRLSKRLNLSLVQLSYFDEIARRQLFPSEDEDEETEDEDEDARRERQLKKTLAENLHRAINNLASTQTLRNFNGSWDEFFRDDENNDENDGLLLKWIRAVKASDEVQRAFKELWKAHGEEDKEFEFDTVTARISSKETFSGDIKTLISRTPLIFDDSDTCNDGWVTGSICLQVADPISNFDITQKEETGFVRQALREANLFGAPWSQEEIKVALADFYENRGFKVNPKISDKHDPNRSIGSGKWRIEFIQMPQLSDEEIYKVLQRALPRKAFYEFVRNNKAPNEAKYLVRDDSAQSKLAVWLRKHSEPENLPNDASSSFKRLALDDEFLYFNSFSFQRVSAALGEVGYSVIVSEPNEDNVSLVIGKTGNEETPAPTPMPTPSPSPTTSPTHGPAPMSTLGKKPNAFLAATLYKLCPQHRNHFFGELFYRPRQGVRLLGGYECLSAGPGRFGFRIGGDGSAFGGLNYSGLIPFFGSGPHRLFRRPLFISLDGSTEFERKRLLGGTETNERRSGASVRAVLPLSSPANRKQFDLMLEGKRQTVALIRNERTFVKQNLTTLDLGARFFWDNRRGLRPASFEIKPQVRFGLGLSSNELAFTSFNLSTAFHSEMNRLFDFDLKGRFQLASSRTPIIEQPSFGGEDTVRGFRRDDAIGRVLWSLQPELWLRVRGLISSPYDPATGDVNGLKKFMRDNLSLALFYDVGGVHRTTNSLPGIRSGPGIGIRFSYQRIAVFKLDWAYGIGNGLNGKGRGRFYFTVDLLENPF